MTLVPEVEVQDPRSYFGLPGGYLAPGSGFFASRTRTEAPGSYLADSKNLKRLQAKQAKDLEVEQQAQLARDLAEAEHEASMAARDSGTGNWYINSSGNFL